MCIRDRYQRRVHGAAFGAFYILQILALLKGFGDQEALNRLQSRLFVFGYGAIVAIFFYHYFTLLTVWACAATVLMSLLAGLLKQPTLQKLGDSLYGITALALWASNLLVLLLRD
eukprot:TRINITY_DN6289_c0_g1_i6.p1 TRINITY_DN6289_c0_g1~~TRINITY_DN6289_c0_g1_i6.p1  ORF type:complete len:115 (+),score=17.19 TRINITY_DN6289_c0_g1_i6:65-409(+)